MTTNVAEGTGAPRAFLATSPAPLTPLWVPPVNGDKHGNVWAQVGQVLADQNVSCPRTADAPAGEWKYRHDTLMRALRHGGWSWRPDVPVPDPATHAAVLAVRTGVAVQDLYAMSWALRQGLPARPDSTVLRLTWVIGSDLAGLPLRSVVGWILAGHVIPERQPVFQWVEPWVRSGLGHDGWLYAAAGFTLAETRAAMGAGDLDPAQAAMLAALRGVTLPVG